MRNISDLSYLSGPVARVQASVLAAAVSIRACQAADVPLCASRGVRLLRLK